MLLLALAVWARFYGLKEKGLFGSDTVYYTQLAESWADGEPAYSIGQRRPTHRPVVLALFGASIAVFGDHDAAIKQLTASLDVLNILLLFAAVRLLGGERWLAAMVALSYGFLPFAVYQSRLELTHTLSTTLVLGSLVLFLAHERAADGRGGLAWLAACGTVTGLAALAHEDLIFLAVGYGVYWLLSWLGTGATLSSARRFAVRGAVFALPALLLSLSMLTFNSGRAKKLATGSGEGDGAGLLGWIEEAARFTWNATLGISSAPVAYGFFLLAAAVFLLSTVSWIRRRTPFIAEPRLYLPLVGVAVYMALYAFFFKVYFTRAFLPFIPWVLASLGLWSNYGLRFLFTERRARQLVILGAVLVAVANVEQFHDRARVMPPSYSKLWDVPALPLDFRWREAIREIEVTNYQTSWGRRVFNALETHVDREAKLLITSALRYPFAGRRTLQTRYYFGDHAVHAIDHEEPLAQLVDRMKIRYVLYSPYRADLRVLDWQSYERYLYGGRWSEPVALRLGASYGMAPEDFSIEAEYGFLVSFLADRDAEVIHAEGAFVGGNRPETLSPADESFVIYRLPGDDR